MALASLILGIIAIPASFILTYLSWYISVPGLILGVIYYTQNDHIEDKNNKLAFVGMILNGIAIVLGLLMFYIMAYILVSHDFYKHFFETLS